MAYEALSGELGNEHGSIMMRRLNRRHLFARFCAHKPGMNASVPIPKFASLCGTLACELRNPRDTSKSMILVRFLDLKFLPERAAKLQDLQIRRTCKQHLIALGLILGLAAAAVAQEHSAK